MNADQQAALREPFPEHLIGKLPKGGVQLDFVGHGAVRDRLLQVDPEWTWEPFALDANDLPALDEFGNLWIRLTICGVTRVGVGDGPTMKERIGDALRNAGMSFGIALDLWIRGHGDDPQAKEQTRRAPSAPASNERRDLVQQLVALGLPTAGDVETLRTRLAEHQPSTTTAEDLAARAEAQRQKVAAEQPIDVKQKAAGG